MNLSDTFRFTSQLQSPNPKDRIMALFQISGRIIAAGDAGMVPVDAEGAHPVYCYGAKVPLSFMGSPLFLDHEVGSQYMTLDKPWVLFMEESASFKHDVQQEAPDGKKKGGIKVVYCFKYKVGGTDGIRIMKAGIMFLQHLSMQNHYAHLWAVAAIMKDKMGEFGAKVACMQKSSSSSGGSGLGGLLDSQ